MNEDSAERSIMSRKNPGRVASVLTAILATIAMAASMASFDNYVLTVGYTIALTVTAVTVFTLVYLAGSFSEEKSGGGDRTDILGLREQDAPSMALRQTVQELSSASTAFQTRLSAVESRLVEDGSQQPLAEEKRTELVELLRQEIQKAAKNDLLKEIRDSIERDEKSDEVAADLESRHRATVARLGRELRSLGNRGTANLMMGIVTAGAGVGLLSMFVLEFPKELDSTANFVSFFLPRFSIALFVEIFAYFFLRLYSNSLLEIKYVQDQITSVESKFLALRAALALDEQETVRGAILRVAEMRGVDTFSRSGSAVESNTAGLDQETIKSIARAVVSALGQRR